MEVLNLKDSVEKDVFFRKLPTLAEQLSRPLVTKKVRLLLQFYLFQVSVCFTFIQLFHCKPREAFESPFHSCSMQLLPLLASALEFGSAAAPALIPLLKIGSWLPQDEFNVKVGFV